MISAGTVLTGIAVLVLSAIGNEWRSRRRKARPLAAKFAPPISQPDLGMEATDLTQAAAILQRNDALAAKTGATGSAATWTAVGAVLPPANGEDGRRN